MTRLRSLALLLACLIAACSNDDGGDAPMCADTGEACAADGDCCGGTCTDGACGAAACAAGGEYCGENDDCCGGSCTDFACDLCGREGASCSSDSDCCGACEGIRCGAAPYPPGCVTCSEALADRSKVTCEGNSRTLFSFLEGCACDEGEPCADVCADNWCAGGEATAECTSCMQVNEACATPYQACASDTPE